MSDRRTLAEKLRAMAEQDVSPNEAAIARAKLEAMGASPPPPRRPAPPAAPAPEPFSSGVWFNGETTSTTWLHNTVATSTFHVWFGEGNE